MYLDLLQLEGALDNLLYDFGYQVVDLQSVGQKGRRAYRLFIDRVDGQPVGIGDCAAVTRQVRLYLEGEGLYNEDSTLEVSSAGLDRILKRDRDFERYLGSQIQATYMGDAGKRTVSGELSSFTDEVLVVSPQQPGEGSHSIPRSQVERVRLVPQIDFGKGK
jgi:ribosome maturation factor RimP